jgi:hypothetical protein
MAETETTNASLTCLWVELALHGFSKRKKDSDALGQQSENYFLHYLKKTKFLSSSGSRTGHGPMAMLSHSLDRLIPLHTSFSFLQLQPSSVLGSRDVNGTDVF